MLASFHTVRPDAGIYGFTMDLLKYANFSVDDGHRPGILHAISTLLVEIDLLESQDQGHNAKDEVASRISTIKRKIAVFEGILAPSPMCRIPQEVLVRILAARLNDEEDAAVWHAKEVRPITTRRSGARRAV